MNLVAVCNSISRLQNASIRWYYDLCLGAIAAIHQFIFVMDDVLQPLLLHLQIFKSSNFLTTQLKQIIIYQHPSPYPVVGTPSLHTIFFLLTTFSSTVTSYIFYSDDSNHDTYSFGK